MCICDQGVETEEVEGISLVPFIFVVIVIDGLGICSASFYWGRPRFGGDVLLGVVV